MPKELPLSQGLTAIVDDDDYDRLAIYKWSADKRKRTVYAVRRLRTPKGKKQCKVYLHHQILPLAPGMIIDHIDGNGLNCRKTNLRAASVRLNAANRTSFEFIGVSWHKGAGKWQARIKINYKEIYLGLFGTREAAAAAYNKAAIKYNGEFAAISGP